MFCLLNLCRGKLNIKEMWTLYSLLKKGVSNKNEYLIDEVETILTGISSQEFVLSMHCMYPKMEMQKLSPVKAVQLFIRGLKKNIFFGFVDFIKGMTNGRSSR